MVITASLGADQVNDYVVGQLIQLTVPSSYGMYQANGLTGQILSINGLVFTVDINSLNFDVFAIPATGQPQPASFASYGSRNLYNVNTVPFHSEGNFGN